VYLLKSVTAIQVTIKFDFNDTSFHTKNDSKYRQYILWYVLYPTTRLGRAKYKSKDRFKMYTYAKHTRKLPSPCVNSTIDFIRNHKIATVTLPSSEGRDALVLLVHGLLQEWSLVQVWLWTPVSNVSVTGWSDWKLTIRTASNHELNRRIFPERNWGKSRCSADWKNIYNYYLYNKNTMYWKMLYFQIIMNLGTLRRGTSLPVSNANSIS